MQECVRYGWDHPAHTGQGCEPGQIRSWLWNTPYAYVALDLALMCLHNVLFTDTALVVDEASTEMAVYRSGLTLHMHELVEYRVVWLCVVLVWVLGGVDIEM